MLDCIVIGGGPRRPGAGLYLARFKRSFVVVDGGAEGWRRSPKAITFLCFQMAYPASTVGRQRKSLSRYAGGRLVHRRVDALSRSSEGFCARMLTDGEGKKVDARRVILATRAQDVEIALPGLTNAVRRGIVRCCPICHGYEARAQKSGTSRATRAGSRRLVVARTYHAAGDRLTLGERLQVSDGGLERAERQGVKIHSVPIRSLTIASDGVAAMISIRALASRRSLFGAWS